MDNPPEPMPKVSIDPLPPSPDSPKSPSPPPAEQIVVTSHEGSVVAVPAAEPTLEKAVAPPASDPKPPSPPPAPPVAVVVPEPVPPPTSPVIPPPTSPVIPPAPIIQQAEPVAASPPPTTVIVETTKKETPTPEVPSAPATVVVEAVKNTSAPPSPAAPPAVVVEAAKKDASPPASPVVVVASSSNTTLAPIVPLLVTQTSSAPTIQRSDTATYEPLKKTDKVPVLVSTKSAPELAQSAANEAHEIHAKPSQISIRSAPPDVIVRRDTHVVVINPVEGAHEPRHWRDRIRKFFVTKLGGAHFLRLLLGKQASNVTTAVVSRY